MMKFLGLILLIILILPMSLFAQEDIDKTTVTDSSKLILKQLETKSISGTVKVIQDPRLVNILRKQIEFNKTSSVPGWSILIYKGGDMTRANQVKAEYEEAYSSLGLKVNIKYNEPDFTILVGRFRTKEDAYRYKQMLIARFPNAYLVESRITLD